MNHKSVSHRELLMITKDKSTAEHFKALGFLVATSTGYGLGEEAGDIINQEYHIYSKIQRKDWWLN